MVVPVCCLPSQPLDASNRSSTGNEKKRNFIMRPRASRAAQCIARRCRRGVEEGDQRPEDRETACEANETLQRCGLRRYSLVVAQPRRQLRCMRLAAASEIDIHMVEMRLGAATLVTIPSWHDGAASAAARAGDAAAKSLR